MTILDLDKVRYIDDVDVSDYKADWIEDAYNNGLAIPCETDRFCASSVMTHAGLAVEITSAFQLPN